MGCGFMILKLLVKYFSMENFVFIYSKDGKVKALNLEDANKKRQWYLSDGWKHTATLNPCEWIEYLCNSCDDLEIEVANLMG